MMSEARWRAVENVVFSSKPSIVIKLPIISMNLKFCSTSGSPDNQAFRVRNMCHCVSTLNQSIPVACRVFSVLLAFFNSKALKHGTVSAVASMSKTHLSTHAKSTPRSSKSTHMTNSINLPSASPFPWRVSSFVPRPSSILAYMPD